MHAVLTASVMGLFSCPMWPS